LLAIISTPNHNPGVECALDLFCRHGEEFPWVPDQLQSRSLVIYKAWEGSCCFHQDLSTCSEMYYGKKLIFRSSFKPSFQRIKNHLFWRPVQGDIQKHWALRSLKSALDRLHRRSKIGTTLLFGARFNTMARWKDNFINYNFHRCFSTCYVQEVKGKLWKMRQQQGRDGSRWWQYDEGLGPWLDDI
jgi:hypothetical protein